MKFYNREREIKTFKNLKGSFRIVVVGRRRIGKTRLVEEFFSKNRITLFVSAEKSEKEIISNWSDEYKEIPRVSAFRDLFEYLFSMSDKTIFIDEIQNLIKVNKSFLFDLQHLIDKYKPKLVVSGSLIRTMKKMIEDYRSPLFGRFDIIIKLQELNFYTIAEICRDLDIDFETTIRLYSVFGGVPKYYELIEKMKHFNLESFVLDMFVFYPRPLYEEVRVMLREEFGKEQRMFFSVLSAISQGYTRLSEIAGFIGKEQTKITKYLHLLINDFEIVSRDVPIINGKKGIYKINSNLVSFWFANIVKYQELIEKREEKVLAEILKKNFNLWTGKRFEDICKEFLLELNKSGKLPFQFEKIGKQWGKFRGEKGKNAYEIDLVAVNEQTGEILFCECKWKDKVNAEKVLEELREKAKHVQWNRKKEYFAIFAKSFRKRIKDCLLFDLKDMEKMMK